MVEFGALHFRMNSERVRRADECPTGPTGGRKTTRDGVHYADSLMGYYNGWAPVVVGLMTGRMGDTDAPGTGVTVAVFFYRWNGYGMDFGRLHYVSKGGYATTDGVPIDGKAGYGESVGVTSF